MPARKGVCSYLSANNDQILKPLLGAVGTLGAKALTEIIPALIKKIANKNKLLSAVPSEVDPAILDDPIYNKLLKDMTTPIPVSNIIGGGNKKGSGNKKDSGVKKFEIFFNLNFFLYIINGRYICRNSRWDVGYN